MGNGNALFKVGHIRCHVLKGQLKVDRTVKKVKEGTPFLKNLGLVLLLCKLVVDILELHCLCIIIRSHPADSVRKHPLKRNALLCGSWCSVIFLCFSYDFPYCLLVCFA